MHVLITGASKGIGLALAAHFACSDHPGIRLSLCSRNKEEMDAATDGLHLLSPAAEIFHDQCDVSKEKEVSSFVQHAERSLGAIDILINNAGFGIFRPVTEMTAEDFDAVLATNLSGVFLITQAIFQKMIDRKTGTIVTISSVAGKQGYKNGGAYCTSKYGVRGLMQSLALEARESNIRVITAFPGNVDTDFFMSAGFQIDTSHFLRAEDVAEILYRAISLPYLARVSELDIRPL